MEITILFKYAAAFLFGPLWFIFSLYYTKSKFIVNGLNIKKAIQILLPSVPCALMSYTSIYHRFFSRYADGILYLYWGFWLQIAVQYSYFMFGSILIIRNNIKKYGHVKKRNVILITGMLLSLLVTFIYYFFGLYSRFNNIDIVPSTFLISVIFFSIASLKYSFLNILPMAFPKIIQNINEGIMIVDYEGNISYCNQSLSAILTDKCKVEPEMAASEISLFLSLNAKYAEDGKKVIEAISKGDFERLKSEVELDSKQFQLHYQPLFEGRSLIGWVISFIDINDHKMIQNKLNDQNQKLSDANAKLLEHAKTVEELTAEKERNKIAAEIHDSQGHCLSLLIALLEVGNLTLENDINMAKAKFKLASEVAKQGLAELRNTVSNFAAVNLSGNRLIESIKSMAEGFMAVGINIDFSIRGNLSESLSEEISTVIYYTCREALTNSLRHGEASNVNVMLSLSEKVINIYIFDNGKGCTSVVKGSGLRGMESRISSINGKISFGSGGEKGFSIHAEIPV